MFFSNLMLTIALVICLGILIPHNCLGSNEENKKHSAEEIASGIRSAMAFYNASLNLEDRLEILLRVYDVEDNEEYLMAKQRIVPPDLLSLDDDVRDANAEYTDEEIGTEIIITKVKELSKRYDEFKWRRADAFARNLMAVKKMQEDSKSVMEDFSHYILIQNRFFDTWRMLYDSGINLAGLDLSKVHEVRLADEKKFKELEKRFSKSENIGENWKDYSKTGVVIIRTSSVTPSDELNVLQQILYAKEDEIKSGPGEEIDRKIESIISSNQAKLLNFIPMMNEKTLKIIPKIQTLEKNVEKLQDESDAYGNYVWGLKEEVGEKIKKLKSQLHIYKDEL